MTIERLYRDHNVPYSTPAESHNTSKGWIGLNCPFCDDPSDHLGASLRDGRHYCWRCGGHKPDAAVAEILGVGKREARALLRQYGVQNRRHGDEPEPERPAELAYPSGTGALAEQHKRYLKQRGFDADELEQEWKLMGTGPVSSLDRVNLANRIVIPIYWGGRAVSWQTRSISDRPGVVRYKGCPKEREVVPQGSIIYGKPGARWGDTGVMVEGVTDVWTLGADAFASFGVGVSIGQLKTIASQFNRVVIAFDPEITAQHKAAEIADKLEPSQVDVLCKKPHKEPGEMAPEEAREFMQELGLDVR